jgi:hypothetical protein
MRDEDRTKAPSRSEEQDQTPIFAEFADLRQKEGSDPLTEDS